MNTKIESVLLLDYYIGERKNISDQIICLDRLLGRLLNYQKEFLIHQRCLFTILTWLENAKLLDCVS